MSINNSSNKTSFKNNSALQNSFVIPYVQSISIILVIIFILGMLLNMISIITILKSKRTQPVYLLILNLALADIVYSAGIPLFVVNVFIQSWPFHLIGCQAYLLSDLVGMFVGVYTVAALSVERYLAVVASHENSTRRISLFQNEKYKFLLIGFFLVLIWLFAFLFGMPIVTSIELRYFQGDKVACDSNWSSYKLNAFFIIKFFLAFLIPFSIILYSSIELIIFLVKWNKTLKYVKKLQESNIHLKSNTQNENEIQASNILTAKSDKNLIRNSIISIRSSLIERKKRREQMKQLSIVNRQRTREVRVKAIKIVLSIVLLFFSQWTPLWLFELYKALTNQYIEHIQLLNIVVTLLSYSNSVANPLLYIFVTHNINLRKFFRNLFILFKIKNIK